MNDKDRRFFQLFVLFVILVFVIGFLASKAFGADAPMTAEQLQVQLKSANERIAQLEERIKLMTLQQQGAIQFFTAGQALCDLDKKQSAPQIQH